MINVPKLSVEQFFQYYTGMVEIVNEESGFIYWKGDTYDIHNYDQVWLFFDVKFSSVLITQTVTKKSITYESVLRIFV